MAERVVKVSLIAQVNEYLAGMEKAAKATRETGSEAEKLAAKKEAFRELGQASLAVGALAAAGVGLAASKFMEFDQAMSFVAAATHESTENMSLLREAALEAGARTVFSATESANAIEEMGKAGVSTADILNGGLNGALDLAAAGGLGVADAAGIAATALQQFQLEGSEMSHVADLLAAGAGKAMGDVQDLANALKFVGPVAAAMNISIEEVTGSLAMFASQGILGEQAGTSLRGVLSSLTSPSKQAKNELDRLGISLYDQQGNFKGLANMAGELQHAYKGMTGAQQDASLGIIFGNQQITAARVLYQQGARGINEWTDAVDDAGYAAETAAMRLDNMAGDVEALGGALDTALIQTGSAANDVMRWMVQELTEVVDGYNSLPQGVQSATMAFGAVVAAVGLAGGSFLLAIPKIAAFKTALATMSPGVQRAAGVIGTLAKAAGVIAGMGAAVKVLDSLANSADRAALGLEQTTKALTTGDVDVIFKAIEGYDSLAQSLQLVAGGDFDSHMERIGEAIGGPLGITGVVTQARESLDMMGQALARMVQSGQAEEAERIFAKIAEEAERQGVSMEDLKNLMPAYQEALAGATTTGEKHVQSLEAIAGQADATAFAVEGLSDSVRNFGQTTFDVIDAEQAFEAALRSVTDRLGEDGFTATMDLATEAGSRNMDILQEVAKSTNDFAAATYDSTGSVEDLNAILGRGREELIRTGERFGLTRAEAERYADQLIATPEDITTHVKLTGVANAEEQMRTFMNKWAGRTITMSMFLDTSGGDRALATAAARLTAQAAAYGARGYSTGGFTPGSRDQVAGVVHGSEWVANADLTAQHKGLFQHMQAGGNPADYYARYSPASVAPQFNVVLSSKGGVDLLKYVDVQVERADARNSLTYSMGKKVL